MTYQWHGQPPMLYLLWVYNTNSIYARTREWQSTEGGPVHRSCIQTCTHYPMLPDNDRIILQQTHCPLTCFIMMFNYMNVTFIEFTRNLGALWFNVGQPIVLILFCILSGCTWVFAIQKNPIDFPHNGESITMKVSCHWHQTFLFSILRTKKFNPLIGNPFCFFQT